MLRQNHFTYLILITAALIALFLYNPWLLYFQNDDLVHIPLSRDGVLLQHNTFRPICDISIMIDYRLWNRNAWGYHLTNLVLHATNSILVFVASKKIFKKYKLRGDINLKATAIAVLFWIYMNHAEAVFWILGRSAMLGMVFFLCSSLLYFQRKSTLSFALSILFSILAWLSYESAWIILFVFLLISYMDIGNGISKWRREKNYLLLVITAFAVYLGFRFYFTGAVTGLYESGGVINADILFFVGNVARLAIRSWLPPFQDQRILIAAFVVLIVLITFVIMKLKDQKAKRAAIIFLFLWSVSLLPYITLGVDTKGVESERFLYMPSFFICIVLAIIIFQWRRLVRTAAITAICTISLLVLSYHAKQYRFAGSVVKNTINVIDSLHDKTRLIADRVPQENFGALIFRAGFPEGVNWLKNPSTFDTVIVLSQSHVDLPLRKNYPGVYSHDISLIPDTTIRRHFSANAAYLLYTDSSITIITSADGRE